MSTFGWSVVVCVLVAACGGSGSTTKSGRAARPASSAPASSALVSSADGSFQTVIPRGFQDAIEQPSTVKRVYAVAAPGMAIDVVRGLAPPKVNLDMFAREGRSGLARTNPADRDFSAIQKLSVAGAPARSFSHFGLSEQGKPAVYGQFYILHGPWLYGIGAIAPPGRLSELQAALGQVIASWHWTS